MNFDQCLMIITIVLSGSRRGFVVIGVMLLVYVFKNLLTIINFKRRSIRNKLAYFSTAIIIVFIINNVNIDVSKNIYEFEKILNRIDTILNSTEKNGSFSERTIRWNYAGELINDYSISQIIFGNGFKYLALYGKKFGHSGEAEGYPHNIIISQMLFSGLVGVAILLLLYYQIIKLYLKYFEILKIFFYFFIIATVFQFTSSNTFFSLKIYVLLVILPFIYHKIILRSKIAKSNFNSLK